MNQSVSVELKLFRQLLLFPYVKEKKKISFYGSFEGNGFQVKKNTKNSDKTEYF